MLRTLSVIALALLAFSAICRAEDAQADEKKKMIGVWRGGWPDDKTPRFEITITADKITGKDLTNGRDLGTGSFTLDVAKKTIDAVNSQNKTYLGLYSLDGDSLKWASDNGRGGNRPTALVHRPPQSFYMVLTRQK
ncbi:MAG TPA: hypothetical protein VKX17_26395 [Planctomycetota bacterium]|nr:hypothetical protein [Planctomycetota bacterium]